MKNIAILLNTKERNNILIKILKYYDYNRFLGTIYIGNASSTNSFNELDNFIKQCKNLKIKHFHFPKFNKQYLNGVTIKEMLKFVREKFVIITGDDDYINLNNLGLYSNFLNNNNQYSGCHGYGLHYDFDKNVYFDKIKTYGYEQRLPSCRIEKLIQEYTVLQFSLIKLDIIKKAYDDIEDILDPLLIEIYVVIKILIYGKCKYFNKLHLIRGHFGAKKYVGNVWEIDDIRKKEWHISINFFINYFDRLNENHEDKLIAKQIKLFISNYYTEKLLKSFSNITNKNNMQKRNIFKKIYDICKKTFIRIEIKKLKKENRNIII